MEYEEKGKVEKGRKGCKSGEISKPGWELSSSGIMGGVLN